ncbi:MAG: DUF4836 family protein, partial [Chitinophagaceae bacterium]
CGKKAPGYTKYIPKQASNIISVDVKSLLTKLNNDSLTVENMLALLKDTSNPDDYKTAITKYTELKDAGVDWDSKVYISAGSLGMMGNGSTPEVQVVAGMKDVKKLETFLKLQSKNTEIIKADGYSYSAQEEMAIGWNDDAVMVVFGGKNKSYPDYSPDDTTMGTKPKSEANASGAVEKLKKYFKLEKKESILTVDGFNDLQGKKADIAIFNQANLDGVSAMAFAFVPKLKELIEGAYSATTVNFEDGKAVIENSGFVGEKMGDILKKYAGPEVDLGMIENYPSQNINGAMAFSFKPELIPALIRETGLDALLGLGLAQTGMGLDDFAKVFKGDFAVVVSDFTMEKKDMGKDAGMYKSEMPAAKLIFAAKIGDKAAFEKLVNLAVKQGGIIRSGNMLIPADKGVPAADIHFAISTANDMLTFASDSATLVAYQSKSQKIGLSDDIKSKMKGNAIAAYIDVEKILAGVSPNLFDSAQMEPQNVLARAKTTFKNGWFTGSNFDGKSINGKGEIVFADPKKNSLVQLVRFSMYAAEQGKIHQQQRMKEWTETTDSDSVRVKMPGYDKKSK